MASKLCWAIISSIIIFFFIVEANGYPPKYFNVKYYGAVADGHKDASKAFLRAWEDACKWKGRSRVWIPHGVYMVHSVIFMGPCYGEIKFIIKGLLKAPTKPYLFFGYNTWIGFQYVDNLTVKGGGYLDGQGASGWKYNDCHRNPHCKPLPANLRFDFVTNLRIHHIRSINSKSIHLNLFACDRVKVTKVRLSAPENSPNTDGIHIGSSTNLLIKKVVIGTGDDCIAMVSGSKNITISEVSCGPGHGISIGSLGRAFEKEHVAGIKVLNTNFTNTDNGVRIKTWAPSLSTSASDITFSGIYMKNVTNPIFIDQNYCPHSSCSDLGTSLVRISDVTFKNIQGTSNSKIAINLQCSKLVPCKNVRLENINLGYYGPKGPAISSCSNVVGKSYGKQFPPGCL